MEAAEPKIKDKAGRTDLWACLRRELHHHRQSANAEWSLSAEQLNRLESIHDRFAPADPLEQVAWLFEHGAVLPNPSHEGWQAQAMERQIKDARQQAVQAVFAAHGSQGILNLAKATSAADYIGKALFEAGIPEADLDIFLETALRSADAREREVAQGLIFPLFREHKAPWADTLIAKAVSDGWGDTALLAILHALPKERWTWDRVAQVGEKIETDYWRSTPVLWIDENAEDIAYAADKLISVGRARRAVYLIGHGKESLLPSDLLAEVLLKAAQQSFESGSDANEPMVFAYGVTGILTELDERPDIGKDTLAELEWAYLSLLQYSRRPAKVLLEVLSEKPSLFIDLLSAVYKPGEDSDVEDPAAEAVRDVIDLFHSTPMIEGFRVGKFNRRGVTTRRPRAGGTLERQEAAEYRKWAKEIVYEHPYTEKALDALADSYEREADFHDENAERLDWQS